MVRWKCKYASFMNGCSYPGLIEDLHVSGFSAVFRMHLAVHTVGVLAAVPLCLDWHLLGDTHGDEEEADNQLPERHPVTVTMLSGVWLASLAGWCQYLWSLWSVCVSESPGLLAASHSLSKQQLENEWSVSLSVPGPELGPARVTAASARDSWIDILLNAGFSETCRHC